MFISATQLQREMGLDLPLARFFVDRAVPKENSFWKNRLLYVSFGNGYLSIPVYYDLLLKIGLPLHLLLDEAHILFMEKLMHHAIEQERNLISKVDEQLAIRDMLKNRVKNPAWYILLCDYLDQPLLKPRHGFGLDQPALNRADVFLYVLCDLPLSEKQWKLALRYWYALHPTYLVMDDLKDYEKDRQNGDENVVSELGAGSTGFQLALNMIRSNCEIISEVNPRLANFLLSYEEDLMVYLPAVRKG